MNRSRIVQNRLYDPPRLFDVVFAGEACRVAVYGVIQQFLVGGQLGGIGILGREKFYVISPIILSPGFFTSAPIAIARSGVTRNRR